MKLFRIERISDTENFNPIRQFLAKDSQENYYRVEHFCPLPLPLAWIGWKENLPDILSYICILIIRFWEKAHPWVTYSVATVSCVRHILRLKTRLIRLQEKKYFFISSTHIFVSLSRKTEGIQISPLNDM